MKKTSMANTVKTARAWAAPDLLKSLAILSNTTVRRSAVDPEDPKPYKSEKRSYFPTWSTIVLFTSFSKTFQNTERKLNGCRPFPNIPKGYLHNETIVYHTSSLWCVINDLFLLERKVIIRSWDI